LCAIFFGSEALLIATADLRSDRSYGFRMFPESSMITVHLQRRMSDGSLVPVEQARWHARDCDGASHTFIWGKMVRAPAPWLLDRPVGAPYGVDSEIHRTKDALAWVLDHTPEDCETAGFVASIDARRNTRPPYTVSLEVNRDADKHLRPPSPSPPPPARPGEVSAPVPVPASVFRPAPPPPQSAPAPPASVEP
jgi:hypothetical protein